MSGEQILRCLLVMQMSGMTYRQLAFHLRDSSTYRSFCRFGVADTPPAHTTLHENIQRVQAATLEKVNKALIESAAQDGLETGQKVRIDSTVVNSAIHHPNDSSLLYDCVRALTDRFDRAAQLVVVYYSDHRKRAKRRALAIANAKSMEQRVPLYRDLLKVTSWALEYAPAVVKALGRSGKPEAARIAAELKHFIPLVQGVFDQTQRRVLGGESVPSQKKIVSIFEPHTDIIVKDNRETLYGHKAFLSVGASGMILDLVIERGNPADATRAQSMIERLTSILGDVPEQAAFDGGFASRDNLDALKKAGVKDVAFSARRGLAIADMTRSERIYRELRNFRAGVEASISWLKRSFGFDRCTRSGFPSFQAYAWASVVSANLLLYARHTTA